MKEPFLTLTHLEDYHLNPEDIVQINDRSLVIKKKNWEYSLAHQFQKHCVKLLQDLPQLRVYICTSHPSVLTNGRGLQKSRKENLNLIEFRPENYSTLPYPLHQIERGGGLTFHHPGQFIFYPIVKLNPQTLSLSKMMDDIFLSAINVLKGWGLNDLTHENKLLGLWHGEHKIASMGIAIEKLTTYHGMALNLYFDPNMKEALKALNPCGLRAETYISVEELISLPENAWDLFFEQFIQKVINGGQ
ncbi:MAG: lipoyl(octanoyl) transferase LipB [Bacteriovoracaceae bacterium]